ncbi:MAG: TetR/AcrR family transcriptional regulator [Mycobacterium sp.]
MTTNLPWTPVRSGYDPVVAANRETDLGLRERKKLRTRATLIDAAMDLCLRQGYEQTTVDQIAAAAEVSPRTYSRYFATKEAVFLTLLEELSEQIALELHKLPVGIGPLEALRAAHIAVLTRVATGRIGSLTSDRVVLILRVINGADALRQGAFEFKSAEVVAALAKLMGVDTGDRSLLLGLSVFSAVIISACGDLVADTDGMPLGPLLMIERINQACEQVAGFAGQIFTASTGQLAADDAVADIRANV